MAVVNALQNFIKDIKHLKRYWKIRMELRGNLCEAIGMNWWKKALSECRRLDRLDRIYYGK